MLRKFFEWFDPREFLNSHREWHAMVEGFCDGFCPWRILYEPGEECLKDIRNEHHYYNSGRAIGFAFLIAYITGMVRLWT